MSRLIPIETRYKGCRFRSRLEARWAVFFDALKMAWEYEPQGFVVDGKSYLPDFRLPDLGLWVEVKGNANYLDRQLLRRFAETGQKVIVLGPIPHSDPSGEWCWTMLHSLCIDHPDAFVNGKYIWFSPPESETCAELVSFASWHSRRRLEVHYPYISGPWDPEEWTVPYLDRDYYNNSGGAYDRARSARFEHGQCG